MDLTARQATNATANATNDAIAARVAARTADALAAIEATPAAPVLVKALASAFALITNDLRTRRVHPTYGITKTALLANLNRALGIAEALSLVCDLGHSHLTVTEALGYDVRAVRAAIAAS